jgi:hypothetical protein
MKTLAVPFIWFLNLIEMLDRLFRPAKPTPVEKPTEEIAPIFENNARETVREIEERQATPPPESEILAPRGVCLRKSVLFRTRRGTFLSAKVVGSSLEDGRLVALSRNGGPVFFRRLC